MKIALNSFYSPGLYVMMTATPQTNASRLRMAGQSNLSLLNTGNNISRLL